MSLTSELEKAGSPINAFFKERFPKVNEFTRKEGPAIKAMNTLVPAVSRGNDLMLIGTAFDYRLRMHLKKGELPEGPVLEGLEMMKMLGSGNDRRQDAEWTLATEGLLDEISEGGEDELAKKSLVLAYLDAGFRSGGMWPKTMIDLTSSIRAGEDLEKEKYLSHIPNELAGEIQALMKSAEPEFPNGNTEIVLGPTFAGSAFVGGADADMILDDCLYEIKTTANPRDKLPANVRQLLGYLLLDWENEHGINQVGFYFSRQCRKISWDADSIVSQTANIGTNIQSLRDELKETIAVF